MPRYFECFHYCFEYFSKVRATSRNLQEVLTDFDDNDDDDFVMRLLGRVLCLLAFYLADVHGYDSFVQLIDDAINVLFPPVRVSAYLCRLDRGEKIAPRFASTRENQERRIRRRDDPTLQSDVEERPRPRDTRRARGTRGTNGPRPLGSSSPARAGSGLRLRGSTFTSGNLFPISKIYYRGK